MKSKITIEIDHDNQPIIKIKYEESEDVRDSLVKRFLETFGADICWAKFQYINWASEVPNHIAMIRPICISDLSEEAKVMDLVVNSYKNKTKRGK